MLVHVGDILLDRDNRRAGREVEVEAVLEDSVVIRTVKSIGGLPVEDGTVSEVSKARLAKAYKHKFDSEGFAENSKEDSYEVHVNLGEVNSSDDEELVNKVVSEIMKLAEPGNKTILDRITALESRVNSIEYGGQGYWKPNVYCDTTSDDKLFADGSVTNNYVSYPNAMTGSVVSNYPSIEEVLEKVLPETDSDEFEYLWNRIASEDKNPHEAVVRLVYDLLTK